MKPKVILLHNHDNDWTPADLIETAEDRCIALAALHKVAAIRGHAAIPALLAVVRGDRVDLAVEAVKTLGVLEEAERETPALAAVLESTRHAALATATNVSPDIDQKLADIAGLRAQCQAAMLRHFVDVSRVMPPEQGRRYLVRMEQLTLGAHEQIEQRMSREVHRGPH